MTNSQLSHDLSATHVCAVVVAVDAWGQAWRRFVFGFGRTHTFFFNSSPPPPVKKLVVKLKKLRDCDPITLEFDIHRKPIKRRHDFSLPEGLPEEAKVVSVAN